MENKQTAVDWLFKDQNLDDFDTLMLYKIAKQMEKEQIINAFIGNDSDTDENLEVAEQYYIETYGK